LRASACASGSGGRLRGEQLSPSLRGRGTLQWIDLPTGGKHGQPVETPLVVHAWHDVHLFTRSKVPWLDLPADARTFRKRYANAA
jgi:hypothetical protein